MENELLRDGLKGVLSAILSGVADENAMAVAAMHDTPAVQEALESIREGDHEKLYYALMYPLSRFVDGVIESEVKSPEAVFLLRKQHFVESHLRLVIESREGSPCCADKTRWLIRRLLMFFTKGTRIVPDYTQEYTYHLPTTVLNTHDEIIEYFAAIRALNYGRPAAYIAALSKLLAPTPPQGAVV